MFLWVTFNGWFGQIVADRTSHESKASGKLDLTFKRLADGGKSFT